MPSRAGGLEFLEPPSTATIEAQRGVEVSLLHFLKKYNPQVYSLWRSHPDLEPEETVLSADANLDGADENEDPAERVQSWTRRHIAPAFNSPVPLLRRFHVDYLSRQLGSLFPAAQGLYPSRPWLAYWSLQAADLLGVTSTLFERTPAEGLVELLMSCLVVSEKPYHAEANADGYGPPDSETAPVILRTQPRKPIVGIAGGPAQQMGHLISAYAAVCALCILHSFSPCLHRLPRAALKRWLLSLRTPSGGFTVHPGGECDIRASYAAAVIVTLLRLDESETFPTGDESEFGEGEGCRGLYARLGITQENGFDFSGCEDVSHEPVLTIQAARYVASRQTVEGGFTCGTHASEAHGAYTQCGLACLLLMKQPQLAHQSRLRRWLSERQLSYEGGFNGRTNKLVDSCYSHWVGSSHVMLKVVESHCRLLGSDFKSRVRRYEVKEREQLQEGMDNPEDAVENVQASHDSFLRAKELFLLDHAQLLDLSAVTCSDEALWDRAETDELQKEDCVDQFLGADDASLRQSSARHASRVDLFWKLHRQECLEGTSLPWTEENVENELANLRRDASFVRELVGDYYYNQRKLQQYVLRCCQSWQDGEGGLMDKPECNNDAYHTCYSLAGVSSSQNLQYVAHAANATGSAFIRRAMEEKHYVPGEKENYGVVVGVEGPSVGAEVSVLRSTNPIFNLHRSRVVKAMSAWGVKTFI